FHLPFPILCSTAVGTCDVESWGRVSSVRRECIGPHRPCHRNRSSRLALYRTPTGKINENSAGIPAAPAPPPSGRRLTEAKVGQWLNWLSLDRSWSRYPAPYFLLLA